MSAPTRKDGTWRAPGTGAPRPPRRFDKTSLNPGTTTRVHRDYAAHWFRWGFVGRRLFGKSVLDVGCGPDAMLWRVAFHSAQGMTTRPETYVGVDLNRVPTTEQRGVTIIGGFDFIARWPELLDKYGQFDVVCCFEVIEHMARPDADALLAGIRALCRDTLYLSTPAYDGHAARNHVHEFTVGELTEAITMAGFEIKKRYGTFGDVTKLRRAATPAHAAVMAELSEYYAHDVMACFLAPLYPDACGNNLWVCTPTGEAKLVDQPPPVQQETPTPPPLPPVPQSPPPPPTRQGTLW